MAMFVQFIIYVCIGFTTIITLKNVKGKQKIVCLLKYTECRIYMNCAYLPYS